MKINRNLYIYLHTEMGDYLTFCDSRIFLAIFRHIILIRTCLSRVACKSITRTAESCSAKSRLPLLSLLPTSADFSVPGFCTGCCCCCDWCCWCCWLVVCWISFCPITTLHSECLARIACPASPHTLQKTTYTQLRECTTIMHDTMIDTFV